MKRSAEHESINILTACWGVWLMAVRAATGVCHLERSEANKWPWYPPTQCNVRGDCRIDSLHSGENKAWTIRLIRNTQGSAQGRDYWAVQNGSGSGLMGRRASSTESSGQGKTWIWTMRNKETGGLFKCYRMILQQQWGRTWEHCKQLPAV